MHASRLYLLGMIWCMVLTALSGCTPLMPTVERTADERYQTRIVYDPLRPMDVSGIVCLRLATSLSANMAGARAHLLQNLDLVADMINEITNIKAEIGTDLFLTDPRLFETPIIMSQGQPTETELEQVTDYLMAGGFVMNAGDLDIYREGLEKYGGLVWGTDMRSDYLDEGHPIFSAYNNVNVPDARRLQGLYVNGRLAGVTFSFPPLLRDTDGSILNYDGSIYSMAVNIVIYALTQEGSMAQRPMQQ